MLVNEPHRLLEAIARTPWAIDIQKAREIQALLELRAMGDQRSDDEIRAAVESRAVLPSLPQGTQGVAIIPLHGIIAQRMSAFRESSGGASLGSFMERFDAALADSGIDTIVFHVDSPGGSVSGITEASAKIHAARGQKRMIAVVDPLMASAAYWIASSADEITITPSGRAGSIGVVAFHTEFSRMDEQLGIRTTVFSAGEFKAEGNTHEPLSEEAEEHIQQDIEDYYTLFANDVARNRAISSEDVRNGLGRGLALTAQRAVDDGLVDRIATFDEVIQELTGSRAIQGSGSSRAVANTPQPEASQAMESGETRAEGHDVDVTAASTSADVSTPSNPDGATGVAETPPASAEAQRTTQEAPSGQEKRMETETSTAPQSGANEADVIAQERLRVTAINDVCDLHDGIVTAQDRAAWLKSDVTIDAVLAEVVERKRNKAEASASAVPVPDAALRPDTTPRVERVEDRAAQEPGIMMARFIRAYAAGNGDRAESIRWATENGYPEIAAAMTSGNLGSGGALVPESYLGSEFIELLRPLSAVRSLNPTLWPLDRGQATVPKLTGGATASYKGEAKKATKSEATTGRINLVAKQLIALVPISTQLIRRSSPQADVVVRDDTVAAVAQRSDLAFIRGDGTQHTPKGLLNLALAANKFDANSTVNLDNVTNDLGKAQLKLEEADVRMLRPGWIMAPRSKQYLFDVRDGNGNFAFREEMRDGTLNGFPFAVTSQIPSNLGGGGDESEVYFADFVDVVIGDEETLRVDVSSEATYHDGATVVSAFENDEVLLRVIAEHDMGLRHDESVAIIEAVTWGV